MLAKISVQPALLLHASRSENQRPMQSAYCNHFMKPVRFLLHIFFKCHGRAANYLYIYTKLA